MISHQLLSDEGILIVEPQGALEASDFENLAAAVDPYIEEQGGLDGLMIVAEAFPGWESFAALLSHLRFVRDHHRYIRRVAAVSDDRFVSIAPHVADHFVDAELRYFPFAERERAMEWLRERPA